MSIRTAGADAEDSEVGEAEATIGRIASVIAELDGTDRTAQAAAKLFGRATNGVATKIRKARS